MADESNLDLDVDFDGKQQVVRVMVVEACGYTRKGDPTITLDCDTPRALEREIERLKAELDGIAELGKESFGEMKRKAPAPASQEAPVRGAKQRLHPDLRVGDVMTREVKTVRRNDRVSVADNLMKLGHFRHVVVLDDDARVAGVVSHRDVVYGAVAWTLGQGKAAHDKALDSYPVKDVMATSVATVDSETPLREAAKLMADRKLGCLPVVDGGELVGILTEGDFLFLLAG